VFENNYLLSRTLCKKKVQIKATFCLSAHHEGKVGWECKMQLIEAFGQLHYLAASLGKELLVAVDRSWVGMRANLDMMK
jgi:hypothetical protein